MSKYRGTVVKVREVSREANGGHLWVRWLWREIHTGEHFISSFTTTPRVPETMVFAADEYGCIESWGEMGVSYEWLNHYDAMRFAGYKIGKW